MPNNENDLTPMLSSESMGDAERLWYVFRTRLFAFVRSRVADDQTTEDILQSAFMRMHKSLAMGKTLDDPRAWVFAITKNAITDHYREQSSRARTALALGVEPAAEQTASVDNVSVTLSGCMWPFLDALDEPYRSALRMTAFEGKTQPAAASELGISVSGMKSRVQRGRQKLRILLEDCCAIELDTRGRPLSLTPRTPCDCVDGSEQRYGKC